MQTAVVKATPPRGERFHNLVSSGVLTPVEWFDDAGERRCIYEVGENKSAVDYLWSLRNAVKKVAENKNSRAFF